MAALWHRGEWPWSEAWNRVGKRWAAETGTIGWVLSWADRCFPLADCRRPFHSVGATSSSWPATCPYHCCYQNRGRSGSDGPSAARRSPDPCCPLFSTKASRLAIPVHGSFRKRFLVLRQSLQHDHFVRFTNLSHSWLPQFLSLLIPCIPRVFPALLLLNFLYPFQNNVYKISILVKT